MTIRRAVASGVLWFGLVALALIGVWGGLERGVDTVAFLMRPQADPAQVTELDRKQLERFAYVLGMTGSEIRAWTRIAAETSTRYRTQWLATALHVFPGAFILALGLLQFSATIRRRHPAIHRASGRVLLVAVAVAALSGIYFGLFAPFGDIVESSAAVIFGGFMLFAAARAFAAIRRREIARHREWMIRMFSMAIGISVMRVMAMLAVLMSGADPVTPRAFGVLLWTGWLVTLAAAELWIRYTRRTGSIATRTAADVAPA